MQTCVQWRYKLILGGENMNLYMEALKAYLSRPEDTASGVSVGKALYGCYRELHPRDGAEISGRFRQLDQVLSRLTLREYDKVWDLTCGLCCEHEEAAFLEGIRVGISLTVGDWG